MHRKESATALWLRRLANSIEDRNRRVLSFSWGMLVQLALYLTGFGALCKAAFAVSSPLGWLAIAVSCFVFERLAGLEESTDRNKA